MDLKPGARLRSTVCEGQVIVVKAPAESIDLCCGGHPMVPIDDPVGPQSIAPDQADGILTGKRYTDEGERVEILCTKAGEGSLSVGDQRLVLKAAKSLPSSD